MTVIISQNIVLSSLAVSLKHARIGHQSHTFADGVTVDASSQAAGFEGDSVLNALTYERWLPEVLPATLVITLDTARTSDYLGIAAHTLGTERATVTIEYSTDGATWATLQSIAPGDNSPIMLLFTATLAQYWRLTVTGSEGLPYIGVVYIGRALAMQRMIYGGVQPPPFARDTKVITNRSDTGQTLGRTIVRAGQSLSFSWRHLERDWCDTNLPAFLRDAQERAFFIAWRPESHPNDVVFGETEKDPTASNMGVVNYLQFEFSMRGVVTE